LIRARTLRDHFARRDDPYAGGDLGNAQRIGIIIWGLLVGLAAVLMALNPPTEAIGTAGWIPGVALIGGAGLVVYVMQTERLGSWDRALLVGYLTTAGLGIMQWLCGGDSAPFRGLLLLPVLFVSATQPPRRIATFMGFTLLALVAPFAYDGLDATRAQGVGATFVIWCALAAGAGALMSGVRAQRVTLQAGARDAREEARIDSLTGLHNRRAFDEQLVAEVARARRLGLPLTVAMVDIENFKEVNDRWGYTEGDRCLRDLGAVLENTVREPDVCFRWGGDEFALILSGTAASETDPIAERLRAKVAEACARPDESSLRIRFAVAQLSEEITPGELTEMAGMALTGAKLDTAR
jgi:diguanylate cyclase (GGDEF)-like protein